MVTKSRDAVKQEVRVILDMNESNAALVSIGDTDQLQVNDIIDEVMDLALDRVFCAAPASYVSEAGVEMEIEEWDMTDSYCQKVKIPVNALRIVYVKLSNWDKPVNSTIDVNDDLYLSYRSEFAGIRPSTKRPGCALVPSNSTGFDLEAYPKSKDGEGAVRYIPKSTMGQATLSVPSLCYQAYLFTVANLYYVIMGNNQLAQMMANEAKEALGIMIENDKLEP